MKKGVADNEAEIRLFDKLRERDVGEIRFVRSHKGITGNEAADGMADWKLYDTEGEEEEEQEGGKKWTESELKEEAKMGIRWERNRKLMEAKEYASGNQTEKRHGTIVR